MQYEKDVVSKASYCGQLDQIASSNFPSPLNSNFAIFSVDSRAAVWHSIRRERCDNQEIDHLLRHALDNCRSAHGWSNIKIPDKQTLISDAGKLAYLDGLLTRLKAQNHRVLIYSQMTRVIDLLEVRSTHVNYSCYFC